jgi:hypothetical protein
VNATLNSKTCYFTLIYPHLDNTYNSGSSIRQETKVRLRMDVSYFHHS